VSLLETIHLPTTLITISKYLGTNYMYFNRYMYKLLTELERAWCASEGFSSSGSGDSSSISRDEERWLADCFGEFVDRALHQLRLHRDLYPVLHHQSLNKYV
jgi:hypothetical protein